MILYDINNDWVIHWLPLHSAVFSAFVFTDSYFLLVCHDFHYRVKAVFTEGQTGCEINLKYTTKSQYWLLQIEDSQL